MVASKVKDLYPPQPCPRRTALEGSNLVTGNVEVKHASEPGEGVGRKRGDRVGLKIEMPHAGGPR